MSSRYYTSQNFIERDCDVIYIHKLHHARCVSSFLREIRDGISKGYSDFELDFADVDSVYPNAVTPLAGIIDHYKSNGISFDFKRIPAKVTATRMLNPLTLPVDNAFLSKNSLNKVWKFKDSADVKLIVDALMSELGKEERFEKGILPAIEWAIYETMDNVIQHAETDCGYIMGQLHSTKKYVAFTIFDLGQGIYNSLRNSVHAPRTAIDALTLCIQEEVTRDSKIGQGNGLFGLFSIVQQGNGTMVLTSHGSSYMYNCGKVETYTNIPFVSHKQAGTTIDFQLDYASGLSLEKALVFRGKPYELVNLKLENLEDDRGNIIYKIRTEAEGTGTRESAERVKTEIFNIIVESGKNVVIDFEGVVISSSFADELVAKLLLEMGLFQFNNLIKLKGMDQAMQAVLHRSVIQRIISKVNSNIDE